MPSSCGMLRYSAVTSIVVRVMFGGKVVLSKRVMRDLESLM